MPYQQSSRLPAERASRLGHLEVLQSPLVKQLCESFENAENVKSSSQLVLRDIPTTGQVLPLVFGVDGSLQNIESPTKPRKTLAFIKTALIRLDQTALSELDQVTPHPFAVRDILKESALYHATVLPLKHVNVPKMTLYDTVRKTIFESLKDASLLGQPMETLKWLVYKKWDKKPKSLPKFSCPHCNKQVATLEYDTETGHCPTCRGELFLTDMLGFHQDMEDDSASPSIANSYMAIHETLLLFAGIQYFWESSPHILDKCLFVKDGPLSLRAQYSKLVGPIRDFLTFAQKQGHTVCIIGQEKSGAFFDHLEIISEDMTDGTIFIPSDMYIKKEIQHRPDRGVLYGDETNYGAKVFVKMNSYHKMVLNIPTGQLNPNPALENLIGFEDIFATIPTIISNRYEGALLPIELAHGVASLSTYPSAKALQIFAETTIQKVPYQKRFPGL